MLLRELTRRPRVFTSLLAALCLVIMFMYSFACFFTGGRETQGKHSIVNLTPLGLPPEGGTALSGAPLTLNEGIQGLPLTVDVQGLSFLHMTNGAVTLRPAMRTALGDLIVGVYGHGTFCYVTLVSRPANK